MIQTENLCYTYRGGVVAVDDVSFAASAGEFIAVAGANGSGKSTLMKLLARALESSRGRILLHDRPMEEWNRREYARAVGYLSQTVDSSFPSRALDVVMSGRAPFLGRFEREGDRDIRICEEALATCDASELAARSVDELSGGERKRVMLARVLAGEPELILLDEPLSDLDLAHSQQIFELLRALVRTGKSVIVVTHDLNWASAFCDRILIMKRGQIVHDATPRETMMPEVIRRCLGVDFSIVSSEAGSWVLPRASTERAQQE